ncbi:MAG TPA: alkene reductase, partial [Bosea sp. (in: a-proteobacteria)]|nr:alkene reductase [Bosea sp. (in: a-proteobacteria)]
GYDARKAEEIVAAGLADLVAMGRPFIANPDLPERIRLGLSLAGFDRSSLFGGSDEGYTSYSAAA